MTDYLKPSFWKRRENAPMPLVGALGSAAFGAAVGFTLFMACAAGVKVRRRR